MEKYKEYSPVSLPIGFLFFSALRLSAFTSRTVSFSGGFKTEVWTLYKHLTNATAAHLPVCNKIAQLNFFNFSLCGPRFRVCRGLAQFTFGGYIVSVIIGVIFYLPVALTESNSNLIFNRSGLFNEVSAFLV